MPNIWHYKKMFNSNENSIKLSLSIKQNIMGFPIPTVFCWKIIKTYANSFSYFSLDFSFLRRIECLFIHLLFGLALRYIFSKRLLINWLNIGKPFWVAQKGRNLNLIICGQHFAVLYVNRPKIFITCFKYGILMFLSFLFRTRLILEISG